MNKHERDDRDCSTRQPRATNAINLAVTGMEWKKFGDFERFYHEIRLLIWCITVGAKFLKRHDDDLASFVRGGANVCVDLQYLDNASALRRYFDRCLKMEVGHVVLPMHDGDLLKSVGSIAYRSETDAVVALPGVNKISEVLAYARCARKMGVSGVVCPSGYVKAIRNSGDPLLSGAKCFATHIILNTKKTEKLFGPSVTAEQALQNGAYCVMVPYHQLPNPMALRAYNERIREAMVRAHSPALSTI